MPFMHFRRPDYTQVESIHQDPPPATKGGFTLYYEFNQETGVIRYSGARCSDKDPFNYKIGRAISKGRFDVGKQDGHSGVFEGFPAQFKQMVVDEMQQHEMFCYSKPKKGSLYAPASSAV